MVADAKLGYTVSKERLNPVTNIGQEALVVDDLGQAAWVEVVIEPQDVKQEEGPCVVGGVCGLDAVDEHSDGVGGGVVGS